MTEPAPAPAMQGPGAPPPEDMVAPLIEATGTVWDEFLPVYAAMGIPGPLRRGYTVPEVDSMEVEVVGSLLRLGSRPPTVEDQMHDMLRRRVEAERLGLPPPEW